MSKKVYLANVKHFAINENAWIQLFDKDFDYDDCKTEKIL